MSKKKIPESVDAYYLSKLVDRLFAKSPSTGQKAFQDEIVRVFLERGDHNNARIKLSTVTAWSAKSGLKMTDPVRRNLAIEILCSQLPPEERTAVAAHLDGSMPIPAEIEDEYARLIGKEKGPAYQHAGALVSSAVRAWTSLYGKPVESEDYIRANEDLIAFRHMFEEHLSLREFSEAAAQLFHRSKDAENRLAVFNYAVGRMSERADLNLSEAEGNWRRPHAGSARALIIGAWVARAIRHGPDDEYAKALSLFDEMFAKIWTGKEAAALYALACCICLQTDNAFPNGAKIGRRHTDRIFRYWRSEAHDPLILRATLQLASKIGDFDEAKTALRLIDAMADNADDIRPTKGNVLGYRLVPKLQSSPDRSKIIRILSMHDTWVVRYPALVYARRRGFSIGGLTSIAKAMLDDPQVSEMAAGEAICYLAQESSGSSQKMLLDIARREGRHRHRAIAALCTNSNLSILSELLQVLPDDFDYEREAVLNAWCLEASVASFRHRFWRFLRLRRPDREYVSVRMPEIWREAAMLASASLPRIDQSREET